MFKLKYNFLIGIQLLIGIFNSILLLEIFGVSEKADVYLLSIAIVSSITLLQLMFIEQFMYFYNDAKIVSKKYAYQFYSFTFTISFIIGISFFFLFFLFEDLFINLFVYSIDDERRVLLINSIMILIFGGIFNLALQVNIKLLNAEKYFTFPYILEIIPGMINLLILFYSFIFHLESIEFILFSKVIGTIISLFLSLYFIVKYIYIPIQVVFRHPLAKKFIKNSISMRFGHNIHNFLITPIISNILSFLPSGSASIFYYSQKLVQIIYSITSGPSHRIFTVRIANLFSLNEVSNIKKLIFEYLKIVLFFYIFLSIIVFYTIPYIFPILSPTLSFQNIVTIKYTFFALSIWYTLLLLESSITPIGIASKKSKIFIITNSFFIVIYFIISFFLKSIIGIYSIPIAATIAQMLSLVLYVLSVKKILKEL